MIRVALLALAALALAGCLPEGEGLPEITLPPAGRRGDAAATVDFTAQAGARCKPVAQAPFCLLGGVVIVAPNPCAYPDDRYARGLCHELGHVNGWAGGHPKQ